MIDIVKTERESPKRLPILLLQRITCLLESANSPLSANAAKAGIHIKSSAYKLYGNIYIKSKIIIIRQSKGMLTSIIKEMFSCDLPINCRLLIS